MTPEVAELERIKLRLDNYHLVGQLRRNLKVFEEVSCMCDKYGLTYPQPMWNEMSEIVAAAEIETHLTLDAVQERCH